MLKKKLVVLNTTIMLGLGSLGIPAISAKAETSASIASERTALQDKISDAEYKIIEAQEKLADLNAQIKRVDSAVEDNKEQIEKTEKDIKSTKEEIASLEKEIKDLQNRIEQRNEILKERARTYQENGGSVDYIDVLLGSASFKEFVDRVGAVATIMEADKDLIQSNEADKQDLEKKQSSVEEKLSGLKDMQLDLEEMQKQNLAKQEENEKAKAELEEKQKENEAAKAELEKEDNSLAAKEEEIKKMIKEKKQEDLDNLISTTTQATSSSSSDSSSSSSSSSSAKKSTSTAKKSSSSEQKATGGKSAVITAGYKYIGNSTYKFGGGRTASDIANGLFDCSAFVSWAYSQGGYSIPASTDALKNYGTQVSYSDIQPGDLVFFDTYKKDGHVGIYIGGGKFIGSQSSNGVEIVSMSNSYWKSVFNGRVVRI
ncbi:MULTISPECIES: C40 family peptidase [unclassified Niallia]|uniref:coiled-coil domain-containing protein n=1 Tax=unclassified Niallia TaxID=2837522 RepID=UPI001EDBBC1B|nr:MULTISPECIES: C40 family peptidase [unclassified Niallia]MDL0437750.1 NlpC/P60 family protein [Niallia sp. SS-2023]UPO88707.1 NlpC/P60 family protein [Niallia sp. Man26]